MVHYGDTDAFGEAPASEVEFRFHLRWVGQPARSGYRQLLMTFPSFEAARVGVSIAWRWRVEVPPHVDVRGWRWVSIRYWQ